MVVLLVQTISGVGLAATSHSNTVKLVSYTLAIATFFCIFQAWRYAYWRDIPKHKYWVIRLVGYMQTISLQRFWMILLIITHAFGWDGLYPQLDDDAPIEEWKQIGLQMFDDSFIHERKGERRTTQRDGRPLTQLGSIVNNIMVC